MCGIAGFFSSTQEFSSIDLENMSNALAHRGPDASGSYINNNIGLAHRRLSVIDLSEAANQPMHHESGNLVISYNGEVYNFKEIAQKLNYKPKTSSDTEVLLEAFRCWGPDFVLELNGMFAISIFDIQKQTLYLFRDRLGIKPLFVYEQGDNLAFASELKALAVLPQFKKSVEINLEAVAKFLHLGYIPAPLTIYKQVKKFPQGHYAVFDGKNLSYKKYWGIKQELKEEKITKEQFAKEQLGELVSSSVKYRLIADIPYGTFLSGGVDSSLVSAVAQKVTNHQLKTFSIGFDDAKFNESEYARKVAQHIQSDHQEFLLTQKEAIQKVDDLFSYYDEPFADSSAIPTMLVSQMAKQQVTMTLSGDGGDELFMGYGMYSWASRLNKPWIKAGKPFLKAGMNMGGSRYKRIGRMFSSVPAAEQKAHLFSQEQYFFEGAELSKLLRHKDSRWWSLNFNSDAKGYSAAEEQALFDMHYYLPDDLLVKVDRASMRYALETRVPLLDHRIVEFAINLDASLKVKDGAMKYLLKEVLYDYVPKSIFDRPKWGFSIPLNKWLKNELRYLVDEYLSDEMLTKANLVVVSEVKVLLNQYYHQNQEYLYNRIWALVCLHRWYAETFLPLKSA